jgi:hypothetical protein
VAHRDHQASQYTDGFNMPESHRLAILFITVALFLGLVYIFVLVTGSLLSTGDLSAYEAAIASTMGALPAVAIYYALQKKAGFDRFSAIVTSTVVFVLMAGPWMGFFIVNVA